MKYLLLFNCNNGNAKTPQYYVYTYISSLVFVLCCVASGLCDELITCSEEFWGLYVSNFV